MNFLCIFGIHDWETGGGIRMELCDFKVFDNTMVNECVLVRRTCRRCSKRIAQFVTADDRYHCELDYADSLFEEK